VKYRVISDIFPFRMEDVEIGKIPAGSVLDGEVLAVRLLVAMCEIGWLELVGEEVRGV